MAEVVVFHHALGLTEPVGRFAAALRDAGHSVHTPDLYGGRRFDTIEEGMAQGELTPSSPHTHRERGHLLEVGRHPLLRVASNVRRTSLRRQTQEE